MDKLEPFKDAGCFCSAHQDCRAGALVGCGMCAKAHIEALDKIAMTVTKFAANNCTPKDARLERMREALKMQASWKMRDGSPCACPAGKNEDEPRGKMPTMHSTACGYLRAALSESSGSDAPTKKEPEAGLKDMAEREAFKSYCDGNRAPWVESRLAAVAYRMLMDQPTCRKPDAGRE